MIQPSRKAPLRLLAFMLIFGAGLWLRGRDLTATPTSGDESESAINSLTIAQSSGHDQLTVTYLTGLPVQSIAPVRKQFLDSDAGPIVLIDSAVPYEPPWWGQVIDVAKASGQHFSPRAGEGTAASAGPSPCSVNDCGKEACESDDAAAAL